MNASRGYTLVEVLFAVGILLLGVAAAASLSLALSTQEEISWKTAAALNHQEQAARLWQLGLSPSEIDAILPPNPLISSLAFTETREELAGIGFVNRASCTVAFSPTPDAGPWNPLSWTAGSQDTLPLRSNTILLVRPDTR